MRIISAFNDYYDSAMALGQDRTRVFLRTPCIVDQQTDRHALAPCQALLRTVFQVNRLGIVHITPFSPRYATQAAARPSRPSTVLTEFLVLIGGQCFPGYRIDLPGKGATFSYGLEQALAACVAADIDPRKVRRGLFERRSLEQQLKQLYALRDNTQLNEACIEHQIPLALITCAEIVINPCLAESRFFQAMDPWQAFQTLDQFIGGLANNDEHAMARVSDADRIAQHGFDARSFRKPPTKTRGR